MLEFLRNLKARACHRMGSRAVFLLLLSITSVLIAVLFQNTLSEGLSNSLHPLMEERERRPLRRIPHSSSAQSFSVQKAVRRHQAATAAAAAASGGSRLGRAAHQGRLQQALSASLHSSATLTPMSAERLNLYLDRHDAAAAAAAGGGGGGGGTSRDGGQPGGATTGEEQPAAEVAKKKTTRERLKQKLRIVIPHVGLVILSAAYTLLGAAIFHYYEKPYEMSLRNETAHRVSALKERILESLWRLHDKGTTHDTFREVAVRGMDEIIRDVFVDYTKNYMTPEDIITGDGPVKWSFGSSIFFSWTAITTIGYGHIVPRTNAGRMAIIFYALFGIPLILVTIADMGRFLSGGIIWVHNTYRRMTQACWRRCFKCLRCVCCYIRRRRRNKDPLKANHKNGTSGGWNHRRKQEPINPIELLKKQQRMYKRAAKRAAAAAAVPDNVSDAGTFEDISEIHTVAGNSERGGGMQTTLSGAGGSSSGIGDSRSVGGGGAGGGTDDDTKGRADELRRGDDDDDSTDSDEDDDDDEDGHGMHEKRVSVLFVLVIMLGYVAGGAYMIRHWEESWSFFDAFYFCFVTVTTIGFGDIVPMNIDFFPATLAYIILGLIITTMCIDLVGSEYIRDIHFYGRTLGRRFMNIGGKVVHLGEVFGYVAFLQKNYGLTPEQLNKLAQLPEEYLLDCLINGRQPDLNWLGGRPFVPADIYYFKWIEHPRTLSIASERALHSMESLDLNTSRCSTARTLTPREYYQRILFQYCRQMQPDDAFLEIDEQ